MSEFDQLPKSVKKTIRYIKQDAPEEKLIILKKVLDQAFQLRTSSKDNKYY
ncbi:hypothetical protein [Oceanobacillus salinisoli]|uniref:hypothetical protein n=1 Tax=Oceanobacillus salinisoli TaxID=2678611 RepID=UPI0018CC4F36|nr:hypothetical protein [Oceanobacillus salinisoli]